MKNSLKTNSPTFLFVFLHPEKPKDQLYKHALSADSFYKEEEEERPSFTFIFNSFFFTAEKKQKNKTRQNSAEKSEFFLLASVRKTISKIRQILLAAPAVR